MKIPKKLKVKINGFWLISLQVLSKLLHLLTVSS